MLVERESFGSNGNNVNGEVGGETIFSSEKKRVLEALERLFRQQRGTLGGLDVVPVFNEEVSTFIFRGEGGASAIPLRNVRQPVWEQRGLAGEEVVGSEECLGIFVPDMDEIIKRLGEGLSPQERRVRAKVEAYRQAREVLKMLRERFNISPQARLGLAVATLGQVGIWEKMGLFETIAPHLEGAPPFTEILNALFHNPKGGLKYLGVSFMPSPAAAPEVDLVFYRRDENGLARPCGVTVWGWGEDLQTPAIYENVVGLVGVPREMPLGERKLLARRLAALYDYWLNIKGGVILVVDQDLVNWWKENGPLVKKEDLEGAQKQPPKRRVGYGISSVGKRYDKAQLVIFGGSQVGGPQMLVDLEFGEEEKSGEGREKLYEALLLDWGSPPADKAFQVIGQRPSLAVGLTPWIEAGFLPPVRRFYRLDMLMKSLIRNMVERATKGEVDFVMAELYHRLGNKELEELIATCFPNFSLEKTQREAFWGNLEEYEERYYGSKRIFDGAELTHAHTDHTGGLWAVRGEIPAGMSPATYALLMARFHYVNEISGETLVQRDRSKPLPYPLVERPVHFFDSPSKWIKVGEQFSVLGLPVNHSVPGALAFVVALGGENSSGLRIAYLTDFREGPETKAAVESIIKIKPEVLIIEGTNVGEDKPSVGITEERVKETIGRIIGENSGRYVVIQMPLNNLERLANIMEVAKASGRRVAIPLALAQILHEFGILNDRLPEARHLDVPQIGEDLVVYYQPKSSYDGWESQLMELYGVVSVGEVLGKPGEFVVIFPPSMLLAAVFSGSVRKNVGGAFVYSNYWPYESRQKGGVGSNFKFAQKQGWGVISDVADGSRIVRRPSEVWGVHASGHATEEYLLEVIREIAQRGNLRMVVPIHTEHPGVFAEKIRGALGGVLVYPEVPGVRVVGRFSKTRTEIPLPGGRFR